VPRTRSERRRLQSADQDRRVLDAFDVRDVDLLAVRVRTVAAFGPPAPPECGRRDDGDALGEHDHRRPHGDPARVVASAVDRVEDPAARVFAALLLAEDRLTRPLACEPRAQGRLDGTVGLRDGCQVGLRLDTEIERAEPCERDRVSVVGERQGELEVGAHRPASLASL
jgi:hypothetical protein